MDEIGHRSIFLKLHDRKIYERTISHVIYIYVMNVIVYL